MYGYSFLLLAISLSVAACAGNEKNTASVSAVNTESGISDNRVNVSDENRAAVDERGYIVRVGDKAPDFTLRTTNDETFRLSDMRGKVIMLQFTASWCGVCRKEMPFIESEIWRKHKDDPNFCLLGIDRDEPLDKVLAFIKKTGVTYPMALDPGGDVFALYAEREAGITRNVIIDSSGKIVMLTRLYNEEEFSEMCKVIDGLLEK
ncbi:MAG: TlpA family protein disulfide reductase [Tannerella sp.]|jgi:peroxiredoxin|nr:TlpA family protein disulfide reductase [Tannerella sp.]